MGILGCKMVTVLAVQYEVYIYRSDLVGACRFFCYLFIYFTYLYIIFKVFQMTLCIQVLPGLLHTIRTCDDF